MSQLFISHSSRDNASAQALAQWLKSEGFDEIFLDLDPDRGLVAGERWEKALHQAAYRCEAALFLVSKNWLASDWCWKEHSLARGKNKKLFAAMIDETLNVAELPATLTDTWQIVDLAHGAPKLSISARLPDISGETEVRFGVASLTRLRNGLRRAGLDPRFFAWPPEDEPGRPPYPGFAALDEKDAGIFFGRDAPLVEAMDKLRGLALGAPPRLHVVLGASGAGKSSFLRAGRLPRLKRDDRQFLALAPLRPERSPLWGDSGLLGVLAEALPNAPREALRAAITDGADALRPYLRDLAADAQRRADAGDAGAKAPTLTFAIDQAEELFTPENAVDGERLLEILAALARVDDPAIIILFTVRSDSYDRLQRAAPLAELTQQTQSLPPLPSGEFARVIEGPATRVAAAGGKLRIDPLLTRALMEDLQAAAGADSLPLLAFTLEHLWREFGVGGEITRRDYVASGKVGGAIDRAVARAFRAADADPRLPTDPIVRLQRLRSGLIPWLAGVDPESHSPRRNIARREEIPGEALPFIDLLVEERLLRADVVEEVSPDGTLRVSATVEPAHEALLRQWDLLKGWLEADFGLLATLEAVQRATRDWAANQRDPAWLAHRGQRLADAGALDARPDIAAKLTSADRSYLALCRERQDEEAAEAEARRREREEAQARQLADAKALAESNRRVARRTQIGLAAALSLALAAGGAGVYAWLKKGEADRQATRANGAVADAAQAADTLVFDVAQKVRNQAGMPVALVKALLDPILALEDKLAAAGEQDRTLRRSHANALDEAGATLTVAGDLPGASAAIAKGLAISRELAADKTDALAQRDLAVSLEKSADLALRSGDRAAARAAYAEDLAISRALAERDPTALLRADLAAILGKFGDFKLSEGDLAGAAADFGESLAIRRDLAKSGGDAAARRDLGLILEKVAALRRQSGDAVGARAALAEYLAIARERAKDATDAQARRDLEVTLETVGDDALNEGDVDGARAAYAEALALAEGLAADKGDARAQRDLAIGLEKAGEGARRAKDLAAASASFERALAIARTLAADPADARAARDLVAALDKAGDLRSANGDAAGARAYAEEALPIARRLAGDTGDLEAQRDLSISLETVGDFRADDGDAAGAAAAYDEDLAIVRALALRTGDARAKGDLLATLRKIGAYKLKTGEAAPGRAALEEALQLAGDMANGGGEDARRGFADTLGKVAEARRGGGDLAGALAAYESQLQILRGLPAPGDKGERHDLMTALAKVGDLKAKAGDRQGADAAYGEGLAIARLRAKSPGDARTRRELAFLLGRIGDLDLTSGDRALAKAAYGEAADIRRALAAEGDDPAAQVGLALALVKLSAAADAQAAPLKEALAILKKLAEAGTLPEENKGLIDDVVRKLQTLETP